MVEVESGKVTADRPRLARIDAARASGGYSAKAALFASCVGPLVCELQVSDMTMEAIARELAMHDVKTARGGAWTRQKVKNLLARGGV